MSLFGKGSIYSFSYLTVLFAPAKFNSTFTLKNVSTSVFMKPLLFRKQPRHHMHGIIIQAGRNSPKIKQMLDQETHEFLFWCFYSGQHNLLLFSYPEKALICTMDKMWTSGKKKVFCLMFEQMLAIGKMAKPRIEELHRMGSRWNIQNIQIENKNNKDPANKRPLFSHLMA